MERSRGRGRQRELRSGRMTQGGIETSEDS